MRKHPKIPDYAECVFHWVRSEVYQWDQEMYDGSIARFERIRHLDGAFVIAITKDQKIILTKQEQPLRPLFLSLPGWALEPDELPAVGAERELLEETGYKPSKMIHWKTSDFGMSVLSFCDYFIAQDCEWIQDILPDSGEKIELTFVDFDEFLMLSENPLFQHKDIVSDLFLARIYPHKREELSNLLFGREL